MILCCPKLATERIYIKIKAENLGLSKKQAKVYLIVTKLGQVTASEIAEDLNMKRSSVYIYLNELKRLGLVSCLWQNKKSYFTAENPYKLLSLAEKKRLRAQKQEQKIIELIPFIKSLSRKARTLPKVKYYEGKNGLWTVFEKSLSKRRIQYYMGSFESLLKTMGRKSFTENYSDKAYKLGNKVYNITDKFTQTHRDYFTKIREVKYLPKNIKTTSSVWFYDDTLVLFNFSKPYSATVVESIEIVSLLRFMFGFVWQSLK